MRLIDAEVLTGTLDEWEENAVFGTENDGTDGTTMILQPVPTTTREMEDLVGMQPTVDAVPVVRCKDWTTGGSMGTFVSASTFRPLISLACAKISNSPPDRMTIAVLDSESNKVRQKRRKSNEDLSGRKNHRRS